MAKLMLWQKWRLVFAADVYVCQTTSGRERKVFVEVLF